MLSSDKILIQWLVNRAAEAGVGYVVLSPGSRNAPFAIAFDAHPQIQTLVIHDERCAAFIALGLAQETKKPVALCCTSGSACLNYYPAIAESYYRNIPLLVLTADRPADWINQGDGQTIVQHEVFKNHTRAFLELDQNSFELNSHLEQQLQASLNQLHALWKGPVHINIGLNEPLYQTAPLQDFNSYLPTIEKSDMNLPDFSVLEGQKIMVLVGQMAPDPQFENSLALFAQNSNVCVLVENTSNLHNPQFNPCIDRSLNGFDLQNPAYHPDILISFGGAIVSKRIKAFLRQHKAKVHWRVAPDFPEMNTFRLALQYFDIPAAQFMAALSRQSGSLNQINYNGKWKAIDYHAKDRQQLFHTDANTLTDYDVFAAFFELLQGPAVLHLANSSVVRYAQLFDPVEGVRYESNRGTSGIDGSVSTAVGAALASPELPHFLLCGDISLIYDSNAFWTQAFPKNLKIVVIQNKGGGIFQIIPGPAESSLRSQYFEAVHNTSPAAVVRGFGFEVLECSEKQKLHKDLMQFMEDHSEVQLLQIQTDSAANAPTLDHFFQFIKQNHDNIS
ncbi:MAG: 2-succinyl-5-enolpyruvyl-6-hydroxy-3-cyclohexene-1-carboxylic-acid synthase [Flavobacteriales bacterium]